MKKHEINRINLRAVLWKILQFRRKKNIPSTILVSGDSMCPRLISGDEMTISPMKNIDIGNIVIFCYQGEQLLAHRVINKTPYGFACKGDNAFRIEQIRIEDIYGCVTKVTRAGKAVQYEIRAELLDDFICMSYEINKLALESKDLDTVKKVIHSSGSIRGIYSRSSHTNSSNY